MILADSMINTKTVSYAFVFELNHLQWQMKIFFDNDRFITITYSSHEKAMVDLMILNEAVEKVK